jgi:NADH-quinone oxidoreductase subunit F
VTQTAFVLLSRVLPETPVESLEQYEATGGGEAFALAARSAPDAVIDVIESAGLRGRGGAGFATGTKWRSIRSGGPAAGIRYVVANGAEGEPGAFKDRMLMQRNPYRLLEGLLVAAVVMDSDEAFVAVKGSFAPEIARIERAMAEMDDAGWLIDVRLRLVRGPDEYLFGEEKALLEVIQGGEPLPRVLPPYLHGLFAAGPTEGWSAATPEDPGGARSTSATVEEPAPGSNPTLVNNVETLSNIPLIVTRGPEWFRSVGTDASPGTVICTVTGDTNRAGVAELEMGGSLAEVVDAVGGGVPGGRRVKGVLSGVSSPVIVGDGREVELSYEGFDAVGSSLGAAGFLVYDDRRDMVRVALAVSTFLSVESCGQCPPCKLGSLAVTEMLETLVDAGGTADDLERVAARLRTVTDANRCFLGRQEQLVVSSLLERFPQDVALHLSGLHTQPVPPITKLVDIVDGVALLDDRQRLKRPDWTYGTTEQHPTPSW